MQHAASCTINTTVQESYLYYAQARSWLHNTVHTVFVATMGIKSNNCENIKRVRDDVEIQDFYLNRDQIILTEGFMPKT